MQLDHIAYRVADRHATAKLYMELFGYVIVDEFQPLGDVSCLVLQAPTEYYSIPNFTHVPMHAPEIFISDGYGDNVVANWVAERRGVGGIHHIAYAVPNVRAAMDYFIERGVKFLSKDPIVCPGLEQVFTEPLLGDVIVELIHRTTVGFCKENVRALMLTTDCSQQS